MKVLLSAFACEPNLGSEPEVGWKWAVHLAALGHEAVDRIVKTIAVFDDFCQANDPHEEHDFGAFDAEGRTIMFKIDYFDRTLTCYSPDPSDSSVTERVITIMLAEEY